MDVRMIDSPSRIQRHPATVAWLATARHRASARRIEILKQKLDRRVYRLVGAGPDGSSIIAKHYDRKEAVLEATVYRIPPACPMPQFHGLIESAPGPDAWLFVEDVSGDRFLPDDPDHRRLAAEWLAVLHSTEPALIERASLPERGSSHFRRLMGRATKRLIASRDNPALTERHRTVVESVLEHLERLSGRWHEVESVCARVPPTLVHGDFAPKNIRIRTTGAGSVLLAFDWGHTTGIGPPAVDLKRLRGRTIHRATREASPDVRAYIAAARHRWQEDVELVLQLAEIGGIFRLINMVWWASAGLKYESVGRSMHTLDSCARYLGKS